MGTEGWGAEAPPDPLIHIEDGPEQIDEFANKRCQKSRKAEKRAMKRVYI